MWHFRNLLFSNAFVNFGPFQFRASIIILASTSKFSNLLIDSDHRNQSIKLFISQVTHGNYDYKSKISPAIAMEDVSREVKILRDFAILKLLSYFGFFISKRNLDDLSKKVVETIDTIVNASLSIVLIGVGDGPWENMSMFDAKIPKHEFDNFRIMYSANEEVVATMIHHLTLEIMRRRSFTKRYCGMISAVSWIPKGAPKAMPDDVELHSKEKIIDLWRMVSADQREIDNARGEV
ncbi:hypothetical protein Bca52824_040004 [Brassica carinata]|uniref:Copine C-terminal domain-containing protein n=1 Tax=Brassica carinata TaxID=52824 RepID=A0A8X7RUP9_BRACI|nr:hypothetical protein Bca52824_040004 [Brassica carinata]